MTRSTMPTGASAPAFAAAPASARVRCSATPPPGAAACTRRRALQVGALALTHACATLLSARDANASEKRPKEKPRPSEAELRERATAAVSLAEFTALVKRKEVSQAWFFGIDYHTCLYETRDGKIGEITSGVPRESAKSPDGPLRVAAMARERGVAVFMTTPLAGELLKR